MRFVVADNREVVKLVAPGGARGLTVTGKFRPVRRVLTLTDAQCALFEAPLRVAVAAGVLFAPADWPAKDAAEG